MVEAYGASRQTAWRLSAERGLEACAQDLKTSLLATPIDLEGACWAHLALRAAGDAGLSHNDAGLELVLPKLLEAADLAAAAPDADRRDDGLLAFVAFHRVWKHADWAGDPSAVVLIDRLKDVFADAVAGKHRLAPKIWALGALALLNAGGDAWEVFGRAVKQELLGHQLQAGCASGSWDPEQFAADPDGFLGTTSWLNLALEAYYRYPRLLGNPTK